MRGFLRRAAWPVAIVMAFVTLVGCGKPVQEPEVRWTPPAYSRTVAEFHTSGYVPQLVDHFPHTGSRFVDVTSLDHPVDEDGVVIYRDGAGVAFDHSVAQQQYALSALNKYHSAGDEIWLDRAVANAKCTIEMSVDRDGAIWFPYSYPFDWTYYVRTLTAPWFSGMAQGSGLSLFVRLANEQPDVPQWREAADATWKSFRQPFFEDDSWSTLVDQDHLWFEEYAGNQPPLLVLNGHIFALYGLYDYYMLTQDPEVALYFGGGATAVRETMPLFRVKGGVTYYCEQEDYCMSPDWQNAGYQEIHIDQLTMFAQMTGDAEFQNWADKLASDAPRVP